MSPEKMADSVELAFATWTCGGPRNVVLDGAGIPHGKGHLGDFTHTEKDTN